MSQDKGTHEVLGFPCLPVNPVDICGSDCNSLKAPLAAPSSNVGELKT